MRRARAASSCYRSAFVAALCAASGCSAGESPVQARPGSGSGVRFVAPLDARSFAAGSALLVQVWNGEQLAVLERNARCATVHDPVTGKSSVSCPDGITFQAATPEESEVPVAGIAGSLTVPSATVRVGDRFRVLLSGTSADGCNRTSAEHSGSATADEVRLDGLAWTTTARACVNP